MKERNIVGLTEKEVGENRTKYGTNTITAKKQDSFLKLLLESLGDPIIKILLVALGIKVIFLIRDFDWFETIGIVIAIFVASLISTISEYGSEKAFARLQEESLKLKCRVLRNGKKEEIKIEEVVVGDAVFLEAGDKIPADGKIVTGSLTVDESSLNGETKEMRKDLDSEVYRGTVVYSGTALMEVETVGDKTMFGRLAEEIQEKEPESPLKIRLRGLAKIISRIGYVGAILVSLSYLFSVIVISNNFEIEKIVSLLKNFPLLSSHILYAMTLSVTIIVVAVPEGLPMMITLVLSSNMKRMLKSNVLVRKLTGIETAGSLNILFTDKTGTLTKGKLEVVTLLSGSGKMYFSEQEIMRDENFYKIAKESMVLNNASSFNKDRTKTIGGNITDRAILEFASFPLKDEYRKVHTIPFDSKNKYSLTMIDNHGKKNLIKGAPEIILKKCNSYYDVLGQKKYVFPREKIEKEIDKMTETGVRAIALATSVPTTTTDLKNLTLVGILFIKDEVRKEAIHGVKEVQNAHIQTVMITGDNKKTAISIAREVGLLTKKEDIILTSKDLEAMSDEEVKKVFPKLKVVARSLPQDKSRLVKLSQEAGLVVGMTGDGVNDAPALKKADVGFAMGSGTEVSKEASDIVILDDNFASISQAILFGRTIFMYVCPAV